MKRVPETELMTEKDQVEAYGRADFEEPHSNYISLIKETFPEISSFSTVLDLGAGAGDIVLRFANEFPDAHIDALDGSSEMLGFAENLIKAQPGVRERVSFIHSNIQDFKTEKSYELIMSNSLLHHLGDPSHFWDKISEVSRPGTRIFIMDLMRPGTIAEAGELKEMYTQGEPEVLKRDFYNSLLAAFEIEEVREQIIRAGLGNLEIRQVSDRHLIVFGIYE